MLKMAHGHNIVIKSEIECNNKPRNFPPEAGCYVVTPNHQQNQQQQQHQQQVRPTASKMGSRRIFTPQFKLQVLESYRNDSDCKGNQRATARKYGIHRRQIQKWLQVEDNLRSVVANSANNKHILLSNNNTNSHNHNLSLDVKLPSSMTSAARHRVVVESINKNSSSCSSIHNHHHHHHHAQHSNIHTTATAKMLTQMSSPTHVGAFISPVHSYVCDRSAVSFASSSAYEYESQSSASLSSPKSPITSTHAAATFAGLIQYNNNNNNINTNKDRGGFSTSPTSSFTPYHSNNQIGSNGLPSLESTLIQIPPFAIPPSHSICVPSYAYYPPPYPQTTVIAASAPVTPLITGPITQNSSTAYTNVTTPIVAAASYNQTDSPTTTSSINNKNNDDDHHRLQQSSPIDLSVPHAQRKIEENACESRSQSPYDSKWVNVDEYVEVDIDGDNSHVDNKIDSKVLIKQEHDSPDGTSELSNAVDLSCNKKRKRNDSTDEDEAISCTPPPPKTIKLFKPYLLDNETDNTSNATITSISCIPKNWNKNVVADQKQRIKKNFDDEHRQHDAIIWNNHHHNSPYTYSPSSYPVSPTYSPTAYWSQASPVSGYDSSSSIYSDTEPTPICTTIADNYYNEHSPCKADEFAVATKYGSVERWLKQEHNLQTNA